MDRMAELAYIPIYDLNQPEAGVVACLEVAISASAKEALVANIISEAAELLSRLDVRAPTCVVSSCVRPLHGFWPPRLQRAGQLCIVLSFWHSGLMPSVICIPEPMQQLQSCIALSYQKRRQDCPGTCCCSCALTLALIMPCCPLQLLLNKPEDMQRHASGGSSPRSSLSVETAVAAVAPATPAHLSPLRMQPPPSQHMGASAAAAGTSPGGDAYPGTAPSSMPGSPVTGTSYSSRSSTSSRAGSPTCRSSISRTSSTMARTQSIRCMEAADMLRR